MSPGKAPNSTSGQKSKSPYLSFDINAQPDSLEPLNQSGQFQPADNLFQQSNNDRESLVDTNQESELADNVLMIVEPENSQVREKILIHIDQLKNQLIVERRNHIKGRVNKNIIKSVNATQNLLNVANERRNCVIAGSEPNIDLLAKRLKEANDFHSGFSSNSEDGSSLLEQNVESCQHSIELSKMDKLPKYCTWVFLDRNRKLSAEQTLANCRGIYYDQDGEICICSDSDGEKVEEEEKKDFAESEDYILQMTVKEFGLSDTVMDVLAKSFFRSLDDVQARYQYLIKEGNLLDGGSASASIGGAVSSYWYKDLDAALDTFNNLFCRRCLIFDCKLHGCSQELIFPAEKQLPWCSPDTENVPCGPNCQLLVGRSLFTGKAVPLSSNSLKDKSTASLLPPEINFVYKGSGGMNVLASASSGNHEAGGLWSQKAKSQQQTNNVGTSGKEDNGGCDGSWTSLEQSLFEKSLQMFGRNSCLIARNIMYGFKTCSEIFMYMNSFLNKQADDGGDRNGDEPSGKQVQRRSRLWNWRGNVRRMKYKPKSFRYPFSRKRIGTIGRLYPHYTPCACQSPCGKYCACVVNGTTCEKYCGCPRNCKNRFRGCHCAKSQCRSRQCPCFASDRECDPDVCKNCWISCGDGTREAPAKKGDNDCMNMKLLLRGQKKIVLGKSDVNGWGAFLACDVGKDELLGEYTGEVISHYEADKRGKLYDRINLSYLFDLNNQWVLDSYGMGDKLKFANHSTNPNCYPKVMLVAGDHRVGIYSKEAIKAGEEIFYDYQYQPGSSPYWASREKDFGSKKSVARKHAV